MARGEGFREEGKSQSVDSFINVGSVHSKRTIPLWHKELSIPCCEARRGCGRCWGRKCVGSGVEVEKEKAGRDFLARKESGWLRRSNSSAGAMGFKLAHLSSGVVEHSRGRPTDAMQGVHFRGAREHK